MFNFLILLKSYSNYFDLIIAQVRPGGLIIADNVLWSGKVLNENPSKKELDTLGLKNFNAKVMAEKKVENMLIPLRDGLMICRKI